MFKELEITGTGVMLFLLFLTLVILGIVYFFRRKYNSYTMDGLIESHKNDGAKLLSSRTKFPEMDVFKNTGTFFNVGMTMAVALALAAMSWTVYDKVIDVNLDDLIWEEDIEVDIPRTAEPPPPPPPPPPPVIEEVPDTEIIEDQPEFQSQDVTQDDVVEAPVEVKKAPPPPPPPPPPAPVEEEIFKVVEQMPRFPGDGCDNKPTEEERKKCADIAMLTFIQKNLKYPAIARENGVEGTAVIQFVVEKDGSIADVKIVRDIGAGCGQAAQTVVESMNSMGKKWVPGKQRGRPVKVLFTLPVKFKLEG